VAVYLFLLKFTGAKNQRRVAQRPPDLRLQQTKPTNPEPNNQMLAGTGTGEAVPVSFHTEGKGEAGPVLPIEVIQVSE